MKKILPLLFVAILLFTACNGESKDYISQDPEQCQVLRFQCEEGHVPFFDEIGCGCEEDKTVGLADPITPGDIAADDTNPDSIVEGEDDSEPVTVGDNSPVGDTTEVDSATAANNEPCPADYSPVCAQTRNHCTGSECDPAMQTFSNRCLAEKSGAFNIREGRCQTPAELVSTGMGR